MADETIPAIGMSVGATTLAAVTADHAVTRRPVLTLYDNRSPQVGVAAELPADAGEPGLVVTDFVNRVGDSVPVVAADGSTRRGEQLLADALHALAFVATGGRPLPAAVAVSHPAHWSATAVDALGTALSRVPEWSPSPPPLISDVAAALTSLQADPGLPLTGIIAVCDFGGSGTSITLVDAARGYQPIGATTRYTDFSGEVIDQALLNYVVAYLSASGSLDDAPATGGIGSLARLRGQCRQAKERLSAETVTEVTVGLPGFRGDTWVTRAELDEVIRQPFDGVIAAVQESMGRKRIPAADLVAVAAVGGGANIPAITAGLSNRLGVTVVSSPRPQLTAAIGAALRVSGRAPQASGTAGVAAPPAPLRPDTAVPPPQPTPPAPPPHASVWQQPDTPVVPQPDAPVSPQLQPTEPPWPAAPGPDLVTSPEPAVAYEPFPEGSGRSKVDWYRRPVPLILGVALVVLIMGVVAVIALRHAASTEPTPPTVTPQPTEPTSQPTPRDVPPPPEQPTLPEQPTVPTPPEVPGITAIPPAPESPDTSEAP